MRRNAVVASTPVAIVLALVSVMTLIGGMPPARATSMGTCLSDSPFAANTTATCTVLAGEVVEWTAIGGMGGAGGDDTSDPSYGGVGAKITGVYENTTGATVTLYLRVGRDGADGTSSPPAGGEGGGLTAIAMANTWNVSDALVIAGGGGGGGGNTQGENNVSDGGWADPSIPGPAGAGSSGVNDGDHGADGGTTSVPGAGGVSVNGSGGAGGAPGSAGSSGTTANNAAFSCSVSGGRGGDGYRASAAGGTAGTATVSTPAGNCGSGGGGGAGYAGGGGGAVIVDGSSNESLGRGGGAGSSLVPAGATAAADEYGLGAVITFAPATPEVTSVSPTTGPESGGTAITITGKYFQDGVNVTIGGNPATDVVITSTTTLTATTPAGAPGPQDIVVSLGESGDTGTGLFTYTAAAPTVSGISPTSGPAAGGTSVTITGTGFVSGATVTIGGAAATGVVVNSATSITATTPAGTAGAKNVAVTTVGGTGTGTGLFTYTSAPPAPAPAPAPASGPAEPSTPPGSLSPNPSASATTSASPTTSPLAPGRLDPVANPQNPNIPSGGLPAGGSVLLVNGQRVPLQVAPNSAVDPVALIFAAPGMNMRLEGRGDQDDPLGLADKQTLILQSEVGVSASTAGTMTSGTTPRGLLLKRGDKVRPTARTSGDGFASNSPVKLYLLTIGHLGDVTTNASGSFSGSVPIPPGISPGVYTLQANGFAPDYSVRSLSIGVLVKPTARRTAVARESVYFDVLSPALSKATRAILRRIAKKALAGSSITKSVIVGYVQPTRTSSNDQALSSARAHAVASYLRSLGVNGVYLVRGDGTATQRGAAARRVNVAITYQLD